MTLKLLEMRANALVLLLLFNISFLFAQKEAANWYFGDHAGLNFNDKIPVGQIGGLITLEGSATISSSRGDLLFYTDGVDIWDRNHEFMPNGSELFGHRSSTQSAIIIPHPGNKKRYFVFTMDQAEILPGEPKDGLSYSEVDMNLNNGMGDVIPETKNRHLVTYNSDDAKQSEWKSSEKLSAVIHGDENSYWVLTHFVDMFYAFKVDENGVSEIPITTKVNEKINIVESFEQEQKANVTALGYLKISPNGEKIAIAHSSTRSSRTSGIVYLYDFDSSTGKVSSSGQEIMRGYYPYGVEFSPKSKKLYVSVSNYRTLQARIEFESSSLYQFDLEKANISGSKKEIHASTAELAGALQLAINGKIYRAKYNQNQQAGGTSLAAINKPELDGNLCDYESSAVELASGTSSWYGLPPFVANAFLFSFDYEFTCLGEETHFFITSEEPIDSYLWNFGDGTTSTERNPYHEYANSGEYEVILKTITYGIPNRDVKKTIEIIDLVEVMSTPFKLIQCDSDENSEDGIAKFNLELANDPISMGNGNSVDVFYYKDLTDLHDDIDNAKALPIFYENIVPDELVYAKVVKVDSYCYSVAEVILKANKTVNFVSNTAIGCNLGDDTGQFDLNAQKDVIKNKLGLDANSAISFHLTENLALLGYDALPEEYISKAKTIYLRVENENICYGTGNLVLEIHDLPNIKLEEEFSICQSSFPIRINAGVEGNKRSNFIFDWESGEITHDLEIYDEGEFNVLITNRATGCSQLRRIRVKNIKQPEIQEIEIEENLDSYTATIRTKEGRELLYSLGNDFGIHRNDPVFTNLEPGVYTAYVSDPSNCYTVEKQFYIFGFPKFFTPNNDGYNDYWEIKGINKSLYSYSEVLVFDRFGKFLVKFKADANWNGSYNGNRLPPDDYWFKISVTDQKNNTTSHTGHFSIVR